ncbi:MAG TPA: acyl-CoA dehydrogenase family protein, partial [Rhizomicrobium sp.]|nr:acyl-CoA dehydrogenase family protein [Rhizomicrobium sp.]
MDLAYSPEYEAFRAEVRAFLETHRKDFPAPYGGGRPSAETLAWQKLLIEHGYAARTIPREYGGYGAESDILKSRIIAEEFTAARAPGAIANQGVSMLVPTLLEIGSEEQKRAYIKPTLLGEMIWCQGYSEPGAGSDLASIQTRAVE